MALAPERGGSVVMAGALTWGTKSWGFSVRVLEGASGDEKSLLSSVPSQVVPLQPL